MKKACSLLVAIATFLSLCSCGGEALSAEQVAVKYLLAKEEYNYNAFSRFDVVSQEEKHQASVESIAESDEITAKEAETLIFEGASASYGVNIKSYKELNKAIHNATKSNLEEYYGKDYSVEVIVDETKELTSDEISDMFDKASSEHEKTNIVLSDYVDPSQIEQGIKISATVSFNGNNVDEEEKKEYTMHLGLVNGSWKVFDIKNTLNESGVGKPKDGTRLELTNAMLQTIKKEVYGHSFDLACYLVFNNMYGKSVDIKEFVLTTAKQTDSYTFVAYGKLYYKTNYGENVYTNAQVIYTAEANRREETGYKIVRNYKVDTN